MKQALFLPKKKKKALSLIPATHKVLRKPSQKGNDWITKMPEVFILSRTRQMLEEGTGRGRSGS
jgi:hypothetical protein